MPVVVVGRPPLTIIIRLSTTDIGILYVSDLNPKKNVVNLRFVTSIVHMNEHLVVPNGRRMIAGNLFSVETYNSAVY